MRDKLVRGKLCKKDPLKYSKTGKAYLNFSISISQLKPGLDKKNQENYRDYKNFDTVFHNCVAFGDLAEAVNALDLKSRLTVSGDEETQTWKDRQTGQDRSKVVISVKDALVSLTRGSTTQSNRGAYATQPGQEPPPLGEPYSNFNEQDIPY